MYDNDIYPANDLRVPRLSMPSVFIISDADISAIGSDIGSPEIKAKIGDYHVVDKQAAS